MSADRIADALNLADRWSLVGAKLPREVERNLDKLRAVRDVSLDAAAISVDFDPADAASVIDDLAYDLSLGDGRPPMFGQPQSHRSTARSLVMNRLASAVLAGAAEAVDASITAVTPAFDDAVAEYRAAVEKLPAGELTSDVILSAGPEASQAFIDAKAAAAELSTFDAWVSSLADLGVSGDFSPYTRVTDPEKDSDLAALREAESRASAPEKAIGPVWLTAVRRGVPFRIVGGSERVHDGEESWSNPYAVGPGVNW